MHLLPGKRFTTLNTIYHADAMDLLRNLPDDSVNLIATDPPYFKVKAAAWDHQWGDTTAYLNWLDSILAECKRVLVPNGSLYIFASPQMAARVEIAVSNYFHVLNSIRWHKNEGWHHKTNKEDIRAYLQPWESIVFAEQFEATNSWVNAVDGIRASVYEPIREYLDTERIRANISFEDVRQMVGCAPGSGLPSHWFTRSQWALPTEDQYNKLKMGFGKAYLVREYEDLRREYEDLRRPFNSRADRPYTDVWTYKTVSAYEGKHECEKPLDMMKHIVEISSRPNDVVLDLFVGSGSTMDAARQTGRRWIGCDADKHWSAYANRRLEKPYNQMLPIFEEAA